MARWFTLLATCGLATVVYAEIVEKKDGILSQRISSSVPWAREPEPRTAGEDSSEHGVSPGPKSTTCKCGWANRDGGSRIVGGKSYAPNEYPFIAGIARADPGVVGYSPFCGGSIITPNHIITAAHCTDHIIKSKAQIVALLGSHDRSKPDANSVAIPVSQISQHESYKPRTVLNDISILTLAQSIAYNSIIGPVCLPQPGLDVTSSTVRILGWGAEKFLGQMTTKPKKMDTTVVAPATCSKAWGSMVSSTHQTQICTLSKKESACQGDSGGPVVWLDPQTNRYTLIGLVSFGPKCNDDRPSVHTKVETYLPWIQQQIAATKPGATCQTL